LKLPSRFRASLGAGALATCLVAVGCSSSSGTPPAAEPAISVEDAASRQEALRTDMRKLWEDHVTWTRLFIVSALAGAADTDATAQRLLQNQTDIGNAIKPLYGDAAGAQLTALLRDHILTAADLLGAAKAGDSAKVSVTKDRWYANGDEIAGFLAIANPAHWPVSEMGSMMRSHLDLTLSEAVNHLQGNFAAGIADYDRIHVQILDMADMLTDGIVAQFPNQFGEPAEPSATAVLRTDMRKLWEDHVTWTRLFIVSALGAAPDADATAQRLLRNQTDIGNAMKPLYGDAAGSKLTALLRDHILTAADLLGAAKAGDSAKVTSTNTRWYANADEIAGFLANANPAHWPFSAMGPMMREHLDHTLSEAVNHLQGNYAAGIADYDRIHVQILEMSDMLTEGIVRQHPGQFS
jgi:hypothetical protein